MCVGGSFISFFCTCHSRARARFCVLFDDDDGDDDDDARVAIQLAPPER